MFKKSFLLTGGVETAEDRCQYIKNLPYHLGASYVDITLFELENFMNNNKREFETYELIDLYNRKSDDIGNFSLNLNYIIQIMIRCNQ